MWSPGDDRESLGPSAGRDWAVTSWTLDSERESAHVLGAWVIDDLTLDEGLCNKNGL